MEQQNGRHPLALKAHWRSICMDLVYSRVTNGAQPIGTSPDILQEICRTYEISIQELQAIIVYPEFQRVLQYHVDEVKEGGEEVLLKYQARAMHADLLEDLYKRAKLPDTRTQDVIAIVDRLSEIGCISQDKKLELGSSNQIVISIPSGLTGVSHLTGVADD